VVFSGGRQFGGGGGGEGRPRRGAGGGSAGEVVGVSERRRGEEVPARSSSMPQKPNDKRTPGERRRIATEQQICVAKVFRLLLG
jgi:hypothetical protein